MMNKYIVHQILLPSEVTSDVINKHIIITPAILNTICDWICKKGLIRAIVNI